MKHYLWLLMLVITATCCRNNPDTNVGAPNCESSCPTAISRTLNENDSVVIASLESDSCLYDPELIMKPIDESVVQYFLLHYDAIDTIISSLPDYVVVKYRMKDSYIIVYEDKERTRTVITFLFGNNGLTLSKGICVGDSLSKIKALYDRDVLYGNIISIIEESEMAEIKLFLKHDVIKKIMYSDYESCYSLDLL